MEMNELNIAQGQKYLHLTIEKFCITVSRTDSVWLLVLQIGGAKCK